MSKTIIVGGTGNAGLTAANILTKMNTEMKHLSLVDFNNDFNVSGNGFNVSDLISAELKSIRLFHLISDFILVENGSFQSPKMNESLISITPQLLKSKFSYISIYKNLNDISNWFSEFYGVETLKSNKLDISAAIETLKSNQYSFQQLKSMTEMISMTEIKYLKLNEVISIFQLLKSFNCVFDLQQMGAVNRIEINNETYFELGSNWYQNPNK